MSILQPGRLLHRQQPLQSSTALPTSNLQYPSNPLQQRQRAQQQAVPVGSSRWDGAAGMQECAGCGCVISERYLLRALDRYWHEDCLKCSCCDCRLGEVGSTLFTKANLLLCRRDYLRYSITAFVLIYLGLFNIYRPIVVIKLFLHCVSKTFPPLNSL